ncbi:tetratricopeptide repeat protein [Pyxidicoccus sp. MSG2]|uniref:tetratricopeptide repeat protein n=1 Tax=Pyxidicoccus sp. MSG2 TaxID=2996790 RepID=UPI00226E5920|nr:tetratricopeptide repeat protein [Pyxidicoccus sp. MSG2]MCY1019083.1 tetratricopeptide repeat protein [Pyxidicoccus sp. MSG2]
MQDNTAYAVELWLGCSDREQAPEGIFTVTLFDRERSGLDATDTVNLSFGKEEIPGLSLSGEEFLLMFHQGEPGLSQDGLLFGRHLLSRLLRPGQPTQRLWTEIQTRRRVTRRPLRLEFHLPDSGAAVQVAELPFELLADDHGFLFQEHGASLVRTLRGLESHAFQLQEGHSIMVAWANPRDPDGRFASNSALPESLLHRHEEQTAEAARGLGFMVRSPCRHASLGTLSRRLESEHPTELISLVAHGFPEGGSVWLHDDGHPAFPDDVGTPISASELASVLRRGGAQVALLWTCHGARHHPVSGALASQLLNPTRGGLAAVVSSHAALRAEGTERIAETLLSSLRGAAEGDLERAVSESRRERSDSDLQWAATVYYARPRGLRSVTLKQMVDGLLDSELKVSRPPGVILVENAPPPWVHFRGRHNEIGRGLALLRQGRLVSVTGLPGIGKTEVALGIARRATEDTQLRLQRSIWLSLDEVRDVGALRVLIATTFGADPEKHADGPSLARFLGDLIALVVLDNAEDLIRTDRAGLQQFLEALLRGASGIRFLLATRTRLGNLRSAAEAEFPIGRLPPEAAREALISAAGALLVPKEHASPELERLLEWIDGHPLSLMLVAPLIGSVQLSELVDRLHGGEIELLVDGAFVDDVDQTPDSRLRLKRLISSLNLSWLPFREKHPETAEMFVVLSWFPAGVPSLLLPMIFGPGAEDRKGRLLRANLADEQGAERRLTLPAPIRAYAARNADALPQERRLALAISMAQALAAWLGSLHARVGKRGAREAIGHGAREEANLTSLCQMLEGTPLPSPIGPDVLMLATSLGDAFYHFSSLMLFSGLARGAIKIGRRAMAILETLSNESSIANTAKALGDLYLRTDRLQEAEATYARALPIYRSIKERLGEANTERALGDLYRRTNRLQEAEAAYARALPIFRAIEVRLGEANTEQSLGDLYLRTDRLQEAEAAYARALPIYRAIEVRLGEANTEKSLGDLYLRTNRHQEAEAAYARALPIFRAIEERLGEANTEQSLGALYLRTDRLQEAQAAYARALPIYRAIEERVGEANTEQSLGDLYRRTNHLHEAEAAYARALPIYRAIEERVGEANTEQSLGDLYRRTDRFQEAEAAYARALPIFRAIEERLGEANTEKSLGDLYLRTDRLQEAEATYARALPIYRSIKERLGEANTERALGDLYRRTNRLQKAEAAYARALPIYRDIEVRLGEANTEQSLGDLYLSTDRLQEAEVAYARALPIYRAIEERLGEANTEQSLGDLYLSTNRLQEAEAAYARALPIFRSIKERVGEANVLSGIGNLALHRQDARQAFTAHLAALKLHEQTDNHLGIASAHGYLARAAFAAAQSLRAAVLAGQAFLLLETINDQYGQVLALLDLEKALLAAQKEEHAQAALLVAWGRAAAIDHPLAKQMSTNFASLPPPEDVVNAARELTAQAIADCVLELKARGEDPYSPLSP